MYFMNRNYMKFERYERVYHEKNLPSVPDSQLISTTLQRPVLLSSGFVLFFWLRCWTCGSLVPRPGIELMSPVLEAWSPKRWTTREVPQVLFLVPFQQLFICIEAVPKYISFPICF